MKNLLVVLALASAGCGTLAGGAMPGFKNQAVELLKVMGQTQTKMAEVQSENQSRQTEALVQAVLAVTASQKAAPVDSGIMKVPADYEACRVPPPPISRVSYDPCAGVGAQSLGCAAWRSKKEAR